MEFKRGGLAARFFVSVPGSVFFPEFLTFSGLVSPSDYGTSWGLRLLLAPSS